MFPPAATRISRLERRPRSALVSNGPVPSGRVRSGARQAGQRRLWPQAALLRRLPASHPAMTVNDTPSTASRVPRRRGEIALTRSRHRAAGSSGVDALNRLRLGAARDVSRRRWARPAGPWVAGTERTAAGGSVRQRRAPAAAFTANGKESRCSAGAGTDLYARECVGSRLAPLGRRGSSEQSAAWWRRSTNSSTAGSVIDHPAGIHHTTAVADSATPGRGVILRTPSQCSAAASRSGSPTWIVTSSAVVGSSALQSSGRRGCHGRSSTAGAATRRSCGTTSDRPIGGT